MKVLGLESGDVDAHADGERERDRGPCICKQSRIKLAIGRI